MKLDFTTMHKKMLEETEDRSKENTKAIGELEKADIKIEDIVGHVCGKVDGLTRVLWWLGTAIFSVLIIAILGYVLNLVGLGV